MARHPPASLAHRIFKRLRFGAPRQSGCEADLACIHQVRAHRLQSLAWRLEGILAELDDLGSHGIAIDVCTALERVKEQFAACEDTGTSDHAILTHQ